MLPKQTKQHIARLQQKKYRKEFGEFLVEGVKGVEEAIDAGADIVLIVVDGVRRDEAEFVELIKKAEAKKLQVAYCGRNDVNAIKTTDTFPGVLAVLEIPDEVEFSKGPIICLNGLNDPGNLGTIIRTADWFGIKNILLSEDCVDPYNPKVVRSTMGSIFRTNIQSSTNIVQLLEKLKSKGYNIISLTMDGKDISKLKSHTKNIYVSGSESHGVSDEIIKLGESYTIPGKGEAESLNVAMAAGILMSKIY